MIEKRNYHGYYSRVARTPSESHIRAWRAIGRLFQRVSAEIEQELAAVTDLPADWYDVLVTLRLRGGEVRMHELAEATLISRSAATRLISKLEEAGFVERRVCASDRRGVTVSLTTAGKRAQTAAAPTVLKGLQRHFGRHLDDHQARQATRILEAVLAAEGWLAPLPGEDAG